jgi:hypothetical protein
LIVQRLLIGIIGSTCSTVDDPMLETIEVRSGPIAVTGTNITIMNSTDDLLGSTGYSI